MQNIWWRHSRFGRKFRNVLSWKKWLSCKRSWSPASNWLPRVNLPSTDTDFGFRVNTWLLLSSHSLWLSQCYRSRIYCCISFWIGVDSIVQNRLYTYIVREILPASWVPNWCQFKEIYSYVEWQYFSLNQRFLFSKIIFAHTYLFNSSGSSWNFSHKCVSTRTIQ